MFRLLNAMVLCSYFLLPLESSAAEVLADKDYVLPVAANELKIMSYNVENLFDAAHDDLKEDYEFLPKNHLLKKNCPTTGKYAASCRDTDWTAAGVQIKLAQIKKVIAAQGALPDVLVVVEVENANVVGPLAKVLGYDGFEMTTSPDKRGIDCAVLYKKDKLRPIQFIEREVKEAMYPTRNLSTVLFQVDKSLGGGVLAVFANHWPSQGNPVKARLAVANALRSFIDELRTRHSTQDFNYVLTGDFNTIDADDPNPITSILFDAKWNEKVFDVYSLAKQKRMPLLAKMPKGTYFYGVDNAWNQLDRFFLNAELNDGHGLDVDPASFRIHAPTFLTKENKAKEKIPYRYNHNAKSALSAGYSDHFSIVVKLKYQ